MVIAAPHIKTITGRRAASRGVAMVMVIFAMTIVFVLITGFAMASSLAMKVSGNIQNRTAAKSIAESGLQLAVAYVVSDSSWRTAKTPGAWVTNQAFNGGTFSVVTQDGEDTNGDGVIGAGEGSASFTDNTSDPVTLTVTGQYKGAKWVSKAVVRSGRMGVGVSTSGTVTLGTANKATTGGLIDSFDSRLGPYGGANIASQAGVVTGSSAVGAVSAFSGSQIKGDVMVGAAGNPQQAIYVDGTSSITGRRGNQSVSGAMPTLSPPSGMTGNVADASYTGNHTTTINTNQHVRNLEVKSNAVLQITGHVVIYAEGDVTLRNKCAIQVMANSSLELYVGGSVMVDQHGPDITVDGPELSRMKLIVLGDGPVSFSDDSNFQGVLIAPQADVTLDGGSEIFGAVLCKDLLLTTDKAKNPKLSCVHEDRNITVGDDQVAVGNYSIRWAK